MPGPGGRDARGRGGGLRRAGAGRRGLSLRFRETVIFRVSPGLTRFRETVPIALSAGLCFASEARHWFAAFFAPRSPFRVSERVGMERERETSTE